MTQIRSSEISAKATTSARRISGGCSVLLSGNGVPAAWTGRTGNCFTPRSGPLNRRGPQKVPSRKRELGDGLTGSLRFESRWNRGAPAAFVVQSITRCASNGAGHGTDIRSRSLAILARVRFKRVSCAALCRGAVIGANHLLQHGERAGARLRFYPAKLFPVSQYQAGTVAAGADGSRGRPGP